MAAFVKFYPFVEHLAEKVHDLGADTLKIMLTNTAPSQSDAIKSALTEIAAGNGYTAGGVAVTITTSAQTAGVYKLVGSPDPTITASGGSIGPFRYAVIYNDTPVSPADPLIGYWDYGSSITLATGEVLTIDLDQSGGILTIT